MYDAKSGDGNCRSSSPVLIASIAGPSADHI
jgi:hypothetical protein